jgi:hypothetical protein
VVAKFQKPLAEVFLQFGHDVLDCVHEAKGIDVSDVRARLLGPWEAYVRELSSSQMRPVRGRDACGGAGS